MFFACRLTYILTENWCFQNTQLWTYWIYCHIMSSRLLVLRLQPWLSLPLPSPTYLSVSHLSTQNMLHESVGSPGSLLELQFQNPLRTKWIRISILTGFLGDFLAPYNLLLGLNKPKSFLLFMAHCKATSFLRTFSFSS